MRAYFTFTLFIIISVIIRTGTVVSGHAGKGWLEYQGLCDDSARTERAQSLQRLGWQQNVQNKSSSVCKGILNTFSPFGAAKETKLFKDGELIDFMFARMNWKSQRGKVPTSHLIRTTSASGIHTNKLVTKQSNIHTSQHRETHSSGNFKQLNTAFKFFPFFL